MLKNVTLCLLGLFAYTSVEAQVLSGEAASQLVKGAETINLDPATNSPDYIRLKASEQVVEATFLPWLRQALKMPAETEFRKVSVLQDEIGYEHIRYQQYHRSIPVAGGEYLAHIRGGRVESCNGMYVNMGQKTASVSLAKTQARQRAMEHIGAKSYMWQNPAEEQFLKQLTNDPKATYFPEGELIFAPVNGNFGTATYVAAYKFDIYASAPLERAWVVVNAANGNLLYKLDQLHTADVPGTAHTRYNGTKQIRTTAVGNQYRLHSTDLGGGIRTYNMNNGTNHAASTDFMNASTIWNPTNNTAKSSLDAHYGTEMTYDYFLTKHNRNSYNGNGAAMNSFIHYGIAYNNAFWDGQRMTYGDGDGSVFNPLTSVDIVGHEFSHGVTGNSAQLVYRNESGALNESFSDIFGTAIEFHSNPATADYMIGALIMPSGGALRSMNNPNMFGNPDTYQGKHWEFGTADNGGVHTNSGVQNYWYYLLAEGGQGTNDIGNDFKVQAIGREKAEKIAYRNLTTKLTSSSNYAVAAFQAVIAAEELYGVCSPEAKATKDAWYAVGIGNPASITASFAADKVYSCQAPGVFTFENKSKNATNYVWDFGDNSPVSTAANPTHTYTAAGNYTVKLKAISATPICGVTVDSVVKTAFVVVANTGGPVSMAACVPTATSPAANFGIKRVVFNTIDKTSGNATEGYKDFTCETNTQLIAGNTYDLTIFTGPPPPQLAKVWIDYNNDGAFDPVTELVASSPSVFILSTTFTIKTPATAVLNTPLRMRVVSDYTTNLAIGPCNGGIQKGQAEDYTVQFIANSQAPSPAFATSNRRPSPGQSVTFTDQSNNSPTTWKWLLPGSDQPVSFDQHPTVNYPTVGIYDVTLIVSNAFGTDTLTKTAHINVTTINGTAEELALQKNLNVFPNPATGFLNIEYGFEGRKNISVSMVNVLGQQVYNHSAAVTEAYQAKIDVRNQAAGIYFISVSDGVHNSDPESG